MKLCYSGFEENQDDLELSTCIIYVVEGSQVSFPEECWSDFPFRMIFSWVDSLRSLSLFVESKIELEFFDGPFSIEIESVSSRYLVRYLNDDDLEKEFLISSMELTEFLYSIKSFIAELRIHAGDGFLEESMGACFQSITDTCSALKKKYH